MEVRSGLVLMGGIRDQWVGWDQGLAEWYQGVQPWMWDHKP